MLAAFYLVFRTLFLTTAPGTVSSTDELRASRGSQIVHYTYTVKGTTYDGRDSVSDDYNLRSGTAVKVKYWRFWRSFGSLSHWSLPVHKEHTLGAQLFRLFLEFVLLPALALVIAAITGLPMRRKKRSG